MDCLAFRAAHLDLTDGTLAPDELAAALSHRDACSDCARFDCLVRRSVLLAHNLPEISPRPGFEARLAARMALCARLDAGRRRRRRGALIVAGAAAAASVAITVGAWALAARRPVLPGASPPVASAASVARAPMPMMPALRRDAHAAPWGMPLWSASITLDQTPARFAASGSPPLPSVR